MIGSRLYWALLVAMGSALGTSACVDTSFEMATGKTNCAAAAPDSSAVVFVTASLGGLGTIRCSGVAISRSVIVTARGCVVVPNILRDTYSREASAAAEPTGLQYFPDTIGDGSCELGNVVEDGSFSTSFGEVLPPEAFDVYPTSARADQRGFVVTEVITPPSSRCAESIALLRLEAGIDITPATIGELSGGAPESATFSYVLVGSGYSLERHDVPVTLLTDGSAASRIDPRAFGAQATCPEHGGGAFFSSATNALIGVLTSSWGSRPQCETPSSGIGLPVMPFRTLLQETISPAELALDCSWR